MTVVAPVTLFAFNRPEHTARVFAAIREARPSRLFLVCDGPRAGREGEAAQCAEVRRVLDGVDWPCDVERLYSDTNLGCRGRISSGIAWVFSRVEEAIFLEDDTLPDASFFPYCDELLVRYRGDDRVLMISGLNLLGYGGDDGASYWFSAHPRIWGWASWRTAWQGYDVTMDEWPALTRTDAWRSRTRAEREGYAPFFDAVKDGLVDTWDAQVALHAWRTARLSVIPRSNLVSNIGFGAGATNTGTAAYHVPPVEPLSFPLAHAPAPRRNALLDRAWVQREHGAPAGLMRRAWRRVVNWRGAR